MTSPEQNRRGDVRLKTSSFLQMQITSCAASLYMHGVSRCVSRLANTQMQSGARERLFVLAGQLVVADSSQSIEPFAS